MGHAISVDVKNNKIVRIRPVHFDKVNDDYEALNPWTIEARGKSFTVPSKSAPAPFVCSFKKTIYAPDRIRYPLKRVDWDPDGDRNTQNRGKSKYKRISWDDATDIIASEVNRIHTEYGLYGILCQMDGHCESKNFAGGHGQAASMLVNLGGYTALMRNPDSWEGWVWGAKHVWGQESVGKMANHNNVWVDALKNTELILHWGCDGETTPWGGGGIEMNSQLMFWLDEAGIEIVYVCPDVNYGCAVHADKWIPVLPNTDSALSAALSYVWMTEGTYDEEFVRDTNYCIGFDKWEEYVLGNAEDGVAKTPAWAAPRCGVPEWTIKALARRWASRVTSQAMGNGGSHIRGPYNSEPARMMVYNLTMQGLGNPGVHQLSYIEVGASGLPGAQVLGVEAGGWGGVRVSTPRGGVGGMGATTDQFAVKPLYADSIWATHDNPITWYCKDHCTREEQFVKYTYPVEGCGRVHMVWMSSPCISTCWQGGFKHIAALRDESLECIVGQHMVLENDMKYCDIILPEVHKLEVDDFMADGMTGMFTSLILEKKAVEPQGEAKSGYMCVGEVAKKLEDTYGGIYDGLWSAFSAEDMSYEDQMQYGYDNLDDVFKEMITWEELQEKEFFTVPNNPDWEDLAVGGFTDFRADPEANPLETQTGKIEFECQDLKEHLPDDEERPPVAHYITGAEGWTHNESLEGSRAGDYPLLIISNHPRWREHAQLNSNAWLREIPTCKQRGPDGYMYEPNWINKVDAEPRGIVSGDIVKMYCDRGAVLGCAMVQERIMPGAVYQDHGAPIDIICDPEFEPDIKTVNPPDIPTGEFTTLGIDRSGANNLISPLLGVSQNCLGGMATSGFLVEVEKLSLDEMEQWKKDYPDAFERAYDYDGGPCFEGWVVDEGGTD